jgi:alkaline phosphatase D
MPPEPIPMVYEVATDDAMRDVVQRGSAFTEPSYARTVHIEVRGLAPGRPYWYRFISGSAKAGSGGRSPCPLPAANQSG